LIRVLIPAGTVEFAADDLLGNLMVSDEPSSSACDKAVICGSFETSQVAA